MTERKLSDLIQTGTAIARSISLERDQGNIETLRRYHISAKALEVLRRFVAALEGEPISAWSVTGPYGMGKSSFVNFLLVLCGPNRTKETQLARNMLRAADKNCAEGLEAALGKLGLRTKGLFRVPATSSFISAHDTLAKGLRQALDNAQIHKGNQRERSELKATLDRILTHEKEDSKRLIECYRLAARIHGGPIVLVIDEFGKNLEYMSRYPDRGDLFVMQELAETPEIYLFVCLHLAFETYMAGFSTRQTQEWGKIQGRFEDISFIESRQQMVDFIRTAIKPKENSSRFTIYIKKWANELHTGMKKLSVPYFNGWTSNDVGRLYPIHPLAAIILPELCIRFAQSDRTLFAFLCGGEPNALPAYLSGTTFSENKPCLPTFGPEYLYDYFLASANSLSSHRPEARRWIEINDLIHKSRHLEPHRLRLVKLIGLLNLMSSSLGLGASKKLLTYGLQNPLAKERQRRDLDISKTLKNLQESGVALYREYADEYRLWEGTDFDIHKATRKLKARIKALPLHEVLEQTLPLTPVTASKHSYETGTLRHFERRWITSNLLGESRPECLAEEADGLILYCLGKGSDFKPTATNTKSGKPFVLAYANFEEQVQDLVLDAAASQRLLRDAPELTRDGIARREARYRARIAEERLRGYLEDIFRPGNTEVTWFSNGKVAPITGHRQLSSLLSTLCDDIYRDAPTLRNELINRDQMSSAAARARRELMQAMITGQHKENLGMEGTGPEVAIYRSLFLAENLHSKDGDGRWAFHPPTKSCSYYPAWQCLLRIIDAAYDEPLPVETLLDALRRPPYGMKQGPIPILICFLLLVRNEDLALFQEDAFVPFFGPEEMELMTKQPRYFSLRKFEPTVSQAGLFNVYRNMVSATNISQAHTLRNPSLVGIIGPLVQFVGRANEYTKGTRSISLEARKVRHALANAKDPIKLLFNELPGAVGIELSETAETFPEELVSTFQEKLHSALREIGNAYPLLISQIGKTFADIFQDGKSISQMRENLAERAQVLVDRCADMELKPFLSVLASDVKTDEDWIAAVATIVMQKPVDAWKDSDLQAFPIKLQHRFNRFNRFEAVFSSKERLPRGRNHKEPRLVSVTYPNGKTAERVLWLRQDKLKHIKKQADALIKGASRQELEALTAVLAEKLLTMDMEQEPKP
jgi:hypothetical protein